MKKYFLALILLLAIFVSHASIGPKIKPVDLTQCVHLVVQDSSYHSFHMNLASLPIGLTRLKQDSADYIYLKILVTEENHRVHIWKIEAHTNKMNFVKSILLDKGKQANI